jgi:hypothetical protein
MRRDIYECKANGLIPWALISGDREWLGSDGEYKDGSMDKAFSIHRDGSLTVNEHYYYYKQVTRAGQPGMQVAEVINFDPGLGVIAFKAGSAEQQDAFVLVNKTEKAKNVNIRVHGATDKFTAFRTMARENYREIGTFFADDGLISYACPPRSVSTFFSQTK